jgi:hemerythrin
MMLEWTDKFETGQALVDAQHRMLISYINRLDSLSQDTKSIQEEAELFFRFVEFLETYITTHFKDEEDCMFRFRCPAHQENKRTHGEFLDFYRQFKRRLEGDGYRRSAARELHRFCAVWVRHHILHVDVQLKGCQALPTGPLPGSNGTNGSVPP